MQKWNFYTSKEVKPGGWLKRQLEIQAESLSGNLDKIWRDVKNSAWIGGDAEGWERVPYWLDGFIPLAYLLENEDMIARAKKYIDAIINFQKSDGWICPCNDDERSEYDTWAVQLISKVLVVYYECSDDERIPDIVYKVLRNYYDLLKNKKIKLFGWGKFRWYESFIGINFLYKKYGEEWIKELAIILKEQGADYCDFMESWKRPLNKWTFETHIVNLAMMLKYEAVTCDILGENYTDKAEYFREFLDRYNGTPVGLFTGDECLSGLSPIQGTELCAVAEQMHSYELLYAYTGDKKWGEMLEMLAFNALPATISDDMWTHQYVQMSNQISCETFPGRSLFRTNSSEAHIFGLEPNYGCCTANFNQAWPKFAISAFMHTDDTVINAVAVPSELKTDDIYIKLETGYPFENEFRYTVKTNKDMTFKVRVPSFAENIAVNGNPTAQAGELIFEFKKGNEAEIIVTFDAGINMIDRPHNLKTIKYGSLIFSLPIKYEKRIHEFVKDDVERKFPYCDYEYIGKSDWNYGYCDSSFELVKKSVSNIPFSSQNPPIVIKANVRKINWGLEDGFETVCAKIPESTEPISETETVELYPYGCAKLRMTEMPLIKQ